MASPASAFRSGVCSQIVALLTMACAVIASDDSVRIVRVANYYTHGVWVWFFASVALAGALYVGVRNTRIGIRLRLFALVWCCVWWMSLFLIYASGWTFTPITAAFLTYAFMAAKTLAIEVSRKPRGGGDDRRRAVF